MSHSQVGGVENPLVPHASRLVQRSRTSRLQRTVNISPFLSDRLTPGLPINSQSVQQSPLSQYPLSKADSNEGRTLQSLSQQSKSTELFPALKGFVDVESSSLEQKRPMTGVTSSMLHRRPATVRSKHINPVTAVNEPERVVQHVEFTAQNDETTMAARQQYSDHLHAVRQFLNAHKPAIAVEKKAYHSQVDQHKHETLVQRIDALLGSLEQQHVEFNSRFHTTSARGKETWTSSVQQPEVAVKSNDTAYYEDTKSNTCLPYTSIINSVVPVNSRPTTGVALQSTQVIMSKNSGGIVNVIPQYEQIQLSDLVPANKNTLTSPFEQRAVTAAGRMRSDKVARENDSLKFEVRALRQYLGNAKGWNTDVLNKDSSVILGQHVADLREVCSHLVVRQEYSDAMRGDMYEEQQLMYSLYEELCVKQEALLQTEEIQRSNQDLQVQKLESEQSKANELRISLSKASVDNQGLVAQRSRREASFRAEEKELLDKLQSVSDRLQEHEYSAIRQATVTSRQMAYAEEQSKDAMRNKDVERQQMFAHAEIGDLKADLRENLRQGNEAQDAQAVLVRVAEEAGGKQNVSERAKETSIQEQNRMQRKVNFLERELAIVREKLVSKEQQGQQQILGSEQSIDTLQKKVKMLEAQLQAKQTEQHQEMLVRTKQSFEQTRAVKDMEQNVADWTTQLGFLRTRVAEAEMQRKTVESDLARERQKQQEEETRRAEFGMHVMELEQQQQIMQSVHTEAIAEAAVLRESSRAVDAEMHQSRMEEMRWRSLVLQQAQDLKALQGRLESTMDSQRVLSKTLLEQQTQGVLDNQELSALRPMRAAIESTVRRAQEFEKAYQDEKISVELLKQAQEISEHEKIRLKEEVTLLRLKYSAQVAIRDELQAKIQSDHNGETVNDLLLETLQSTLDELILRGGVEEEDDLMLPAPEVVPIQEEVQEE